MNGPFYGWKLLALLWLVLALVLGFASYGGPIMNTYMVREMQLDRSALGILAASFPLCMGLVSPVAGQVVRRWGARATLSGGILLAGIGALAMATVVNGVAGIVIAYGIVGSAAALSGQVPCNALVGYWFQRRLALALAIVSTGTSFGGFIAAPMVTRAIEAVDGSWRAGWLVVTAVCLVSLVLSVLFVRNKPADLGQFPDGAADDGGVVDTAHGSTSDLRVYKTAHDWPVAAAVRNPVFWAMIFGVGVSAAVWAITVGHGMAYLTDMGHAADTSAMFLSLVVFSGLGGKAVFALLGDRIEPRYLWSASLLVIALAMSLVANATSVPALYACAVLLGAMAPVGMLAMFTLTVNYYGKTANAPLMGIIGLFLALVPAGAGIATGVAFDRFGSYTPAFYTEAALALLAGAFMPFAIARTLPGATAASAAETRTARSPDPQPSGESIS